MEIKLADKEFVEGCSPVEVTDEEAKDLVDNVVPKMEDMIRDTGLGLAGPQIGMAKKFFIAKDVQTGEFNSYFNARYIKDNGSRVRMEEGCLSYPDEGTHIAKRFKSIKMFYQQLENGKLVDKVKKFRGDQAIIFQHECDHIGNGTNKPKTIFTK